METKHTPGPWQVKLEEKIAHMLEDRAHIIVADGGIFGDTEITRLGPECADRDANARLIAAAPTMKNYLSRLLSVTELNLDEMEPETCALVNEISAFLADEFGE